MFMNISSTYFPFKSFEKLKCLSRPNANILISITYETKSHFGLELNSGKQLH